jgi:hypothetical protein
MKVKLGPLSLNFLRRFALFPPPATMDPARRLHGMIDGIAEVEEGPVTVEPMAFSMTPAELHHLLLAIRRPRESGGAFALMDGMLVIECDSDAEDWKSRRSHDDVNDEEDCCLALRLNLTLWPCGQTRLSVLLRAELSHAERGELIETLQAVVYAADGAQSAAPRRGLSFRCEAD